MKKDFLKGFTLAEENCQVFRSAQNFGRNLSALNSSKGFTLASFRAFTLAEVLITLAIIGVVATLTIPTLVTNYKKKTYVTQLKKTYNYLTNGFHQIMAQDGASYLTDTALWQKMPASIPYSYETDTPFGVYTVNTASNGVINDTILKNEASDFRNELLKTFNIAAIYDRNTMPDEYKVSLKYLSGGASSESINSGLYLNDGTYLGITFLKTPTTSQCGGEKQGIGPITTRVGGHACTSLKDFQESHNSPTKLWQSVGSINIDVNGPKGPNQWGRDYFQFYLGNDGNLYPMGGIDYAVYNEEGCNVATSSICSVYWQGIRAAGICDPDFPMLSGYDCAGRIMEEGWEMRY